MSRAAPPHRYSLVGCVRESEEVDLVVAQCPDEGDRDEPVTEALTFLES
ncbi:hypothetical protein F4559_001587 [Saccharothrix violaceirubra]|uniref:Uncharacterized protein n=1 Tax=Saccharothrix violaceirubra TaxID=413306 RepID=A0A7W7T0B5_9PSEU|nr:hypothetical protein [Saccharothrix violaceirubra]